MECYKVSFGGALSVVPEGWINRRFAKKKKHTLVCLLSLLMLQVSSLAEMLKAIFV